jgi:phosphatidylglycerol:prolipoprotein diacylglycerol transferase
MHPILFHLPGGFPVRSFGVMLALGFLLGSWLFTRLVMRTSDSPEEDAARYGPVPFWVLIGVVAGARLVYVAVEVLKGGAVGQRYLDRPWTVLALWEGGLVMYGGMFGAMVGGAWCAARNKLRVRHALDIGLTAGFFGQALGRVGCLLVGDDYGKVVPPAYRDLPFPITLRVPEVPAWVDEFGVTRHLPPHSLFADSDAGQVLWATQPWMSIKALLVGCLGLWLLKRRRYEGQVALALVMAYSLLRFGVEVFRGDAVRGKWFDDSISTSQLIAIVAFLAAGALYLKNLRRREALPAQA